MIELSVIFGLYVTGSLYLIHRIGVAARDERKELEDRVMALSKPDALITHQALREEGPRSRTYVSDAEEGEVESNGHIDLIGEADGT